MIRRYGLKLDIEDQRIEIPFEADDELGPDPWTGANHWIDQLRAALDAGNGRLVCYVRLQRREP